MKKTVVLAPVLIFFLCLVTPAFSDSSSDQIVMYRMKDGKIKDVRDDFSMSEKIYADFTFLPEARQTSVEFRWISPLNKKEQIYSELVRSPIPPNKQTVLCWLILQPSLPEKVIGSRFFGWWRLEIWVNSRRAAEKVFSVGN